MWAGTVESQNSPVARTCSGRPTITFAAVQNHI
jgi:hypothetical protein